MKVSTATAAKLFGDQPAALNLMNQPQRSINAYLELETADLQTSTLAFDRLPRVSELLGLNPITHNYRVVVNIDNSPEGLSAAQALLSGLGSCAMKTPPQADPNLKSSSPPPQPIAFMPTAGGMALGLAGGIGLGMALEALRTTANASGNPVLGNLAIGLGLLGTAIGGVSGATGSLPKIKIPGVELSFEK